jgi:hypothetical protein
MTLRELEHWLALEILGKIPPPHLLGIAPSPDRGRAATRYLRSSSSAVIFDAYGDERQRRQVVAALLKHKIGFMKNRNY